MRKAIGIIPARYESSRFPGKALAPILGKPMLQHVYERVQAARKLERIIIATDDERIYTAAQAFGAEVQMTSHTHISGTDRISEVAAKLDTPIIINIQGDEPLIRGDMVDSLVLALQDETLPAATLAVKSDSPQEFQDEGTVKVVKDRNDNALYFSRAPIPFSSGIKDSFWKHIGIYGYQKSFLLQIPRIPPSLLEESERLEQLRILEGGFRMKVIETRYSPRSVDFPEDIHTVENIIKKEDHGY
ncbi:3-deoxy-manno-octulosonate cytidylyltransferase [Acidobacteriota bacterium]